MTASDAQLAAAGSLRQIPAVEELLSRPALREAEKRAGRPLLREATREVLEGVRRRLAAGEDAAFSPESLEQEILHFIESDLRFSLQQVINATGVILHTNLGRAPLAPAAVEHVREIALHYSNLEYDLERGERGKRDTHTDRLMAKLLGSEAALVVNNNAAAVFLALNTLGEGGEVVVSRGELIEIGGSFRIPDICSKSGAMLREVGTTNRTRLADYAAAINQHTRVLLRVHPSNFKIIGFTERPELHELVELARRHNLTVMEDLGSGCLVDLGAYGLKDERPAATSLEAGADLVTFSGDKLLGGPQAGIVSGRRELLSRIRQNPLFRALRVDKLTIAALEATARLYLRQAYDAIPALRMIRASAESVAARAARLRSRLLQLPGLTVQLEGGESVAGGGSTPGQGLITTLICLSHAHASAERMSAYLRRNQPPVIVRVEHDQVRIDLRTVLDEAEEEEIARAFERLAENLPGGNRGS